MFRIIIKKETIKWNPSKVGKKNNNSNVEIIC